MSASIPFPSNKVSSPVATLRPLVTAVASAILLLAPIVVTPYSQAAEPAASSATRSYSIPAGPLAGVLNRFAGESGIFLSADGSLTSGERSVGVQGTFTVQQALDKILAGTGLEAVVQANGSYVLRKLPAISEATLPVVRVAGNAVTEDPLGPVSGYVARRSMTATKTDTPLLEVPQSISVIGREEMDARGVQDLMEAIRYTPGVAVNMWGIESRGMEWLMLRGFSPYSNISYRDGLYQADFGDLFPLTEPYGLERVEILRGPASVAYGQGDAGGIVNRVSKRPNGKSIREIEMQYGSFDRKQLAFDLGDRVNDEVSYRLVGSALDSNNEQKYSNGYKMANQRYYLAPSLRWQPSAATSLTLLSEFMKNKADDNLGYVNAANGSLTSVKGGDPGYSKINQDQASVGYQFQHHFSDTWEFRQNFRYSNTSVDKHILRLGVLQADNRTYPRTARAIDGEVNQTALDTQLLGKLKAGTTEHTVLLGVDWNQIRGDERSYIGAAPSLDILNPVYNLPIAEPQTFLGNYSQTTRRIGVYVQDQIKLNQHWIVTVGGRQDDVKVTTNDRLNSKQSAQSDSVFSGRAGLTYLVGNGWAPYISYAESFLPTGGLDLDGNPFKPSKGKQVEAGIKFQPENSRTLYTAAVFDIRKTNVVTYDNITFDARQIGKQRSRGLELEAKTELMRGLNATASYTVLDMKVVESADRTEVDKTPIQVPKQTASVWLDYMMGNGLGFGGGVRYIGERWNDAINTSKEPGVTLVDAAIHLDQGPWRFALNAANLFDKKYYASRAFNGYYLGQERNINLTARYRF